MLRLTDEQWERIRSYFPEENTAPGRCGHKPIPTLKVLEAVLWILNTGAQWYMPPQCYPNYKTGHRRFWFWCENEGCVTVTQSTGKTRSGLDRLCEAAARNPKLRFTNLLHHIDTELLDEAYRALNRKAKAGVDGEDWSSYSVDLTLKLEDPCGRLHTNRYRTQAVLRGWIPKANGRQRPIGITAIADKIVQ